MNAAILNADLPISLRMKRANRRGWRIDRPDNIRFLVEGARAYRKLAAPLPWEGTFEYNRAQPAGSFGDESFQLYGEALGYEDDLEELEKQTPYPGIGNQIAKLQQTIAALKSLSEIRHEESIMIGITKGKLVSVVEMAKRDQLAGYGDLPSKREMKSAQFSREDIASLLAETLGMTAAQVSQYAQSVPYLPTPQPRTRSRTPSRSPVRSPTTSVTSYDSDDASGGPSTGLGAIAEGIDPHGTNV